MEIPNETVLITAFPDLRDYILLTDLWNRKLNLRKKHDFATGTYRKLPTEN